MFGKLRPGWGGRWFTGRATLAGIVIAGVVAVGFGAGYTTTRALGRDDSAWLQKGDTIVHVNGPSGRYDAVVADRPVALATSVRNQLEIVETPGGQVYAADPATHRVYKIDLSTMAPQTLGTPGTDVLNAGGSLFVVNTANSTVSGLDPKTLNLLSTLKVPGGVASAAITSSGAAYIGSNNGSVTVTDHGKVTTTQVGPKDHPINVSVVGDEPIAIDTTNGQLHNLSGDGTSKQTIALPGPSGATVQLAPSLSGNIAWLIRGTQLIEVNPGTGYSVQATLPPRHNFGAPLANAGSAYVADDTANEVLVYDSSMDLARRIPVPPGLPGDTVIQMVVKDGNVWADNPTSSEATVIHSNGTTQIVDKGTGNGVVVPGDGRKPAESRPSPAGAEPAPADQSPQPSASPPAVAGSPGPAPAAGPPIAAAPLRPPSTTPAPAPPPTTPAAPPSASPSPGTPGRAPTAAKTTVPQGLEGKTVDAACQIVVAARLNCAPKDLGQAQPGQAPNLVTAVPEEGQTVQLQSPVGIDYYGTGAPLTVPEFSPREDPQTYCSTMPAGLKCKPDDLQQGNPADQVISTTPAPGANVPYGSTVLANYYSTSKPIFPPAPGQDGAPTDPQGYCAFADSLGFQCTAQIGTNGDTGGVQGLADPGQPTNQVVATNPSFSPATGQPYGSGLTATYFTHAGVRVPSVDHIPTYSQACSTLTASQLTCGPGSNQVAPGGVQPGVLAGSEQPGAGTVVAAGSTVNFSYYGQVVVPDCAGQPASSPACPSTPGMTWGGPENLGQFTAISCNVITGQSVPAGTVVGAFTTTVTPQYNACPASVGISEWHLTNANMGKVHYLEAGTAVPGGALAPGNWAGGDIAYGAGYAPVGGACPAGTVPLVGSVLPTKNPSGFYHYAFTLNAGFSTNNWSPGLGPISCVFAPSAGACPAGTNGVYSYSIDNVDWSWTENPGGLGLQWCELP